MSIHRSLKTASGGLSKHRNVLTRAERITRLSTEERFDPSKNSPLGLLKVRSIKATVSKKKKADDEEGEETTAAAKAPAAKAPAAKAGGAKK